MGACCCGCYGQPQVLADPSVTVKARVGDIGIGNAHAAFFSVRGCEGVLYVDGDILVYTLGCCVRTTKLQEITNIEVVDCENVVIGGQYVVLRPGLKISLKNGYTMAVAVPEAHSFADMLIRAVSVPC